MAIPEIFRSDLRFEVGSKDFQAYCISLAKLIDVAIGKNEVPGIARELPLILNQVRRRGCNDQTKAAIMVLMVSVKSACQLGWFPQRETQELLVLADLVWSGFSGPEKIVPGLNSPGNLFPQILERFYPFVKLGYILVSFEANPGTAVLIKDFHLSKKMPHSPKEKVGLFAVRTDDISTSNCIIHPPEVSFLLNGRVVENRVNISMDSGPQRPTNVTAFLNPGANLLQALGHFGGNYVIVIAFMDAIPLPNEPLLEDYVRSEVNKTNSDSEITEGPSRISLSCPISRTRVKLPVKGQVCKHLQCFDFWNYVNINMRRPSWRCPHCNQSVCYTDIRVDQIMIKILKEVGSDAADVVISADGSWKVVTENDENVELVVETNDASVDPYSFLNLGPTVLDLTRDNNEMGTSGDTQVDDRKPCLSEIQGSLNNSLNRATDHTFINQSPASTTALPQLPQLPQMPQLPQRPQLPHPPQLPQTFCSSHGQQFTNIPNTRDSTAREASMPFLPTSMPAAQSSQFQGSHNMSLQGCLGRTSDLRERWNQIYGGGINQSQVPPMRSLHHRQHHPIQNQMLPINNRGITPQRTPHRLNNGGQFVQSSPREFVNSASTNWRSQRPMRGSIMPGSTTYDQMIIRPTRPFQVQCQPPPLPQTHNPAIEIQEFLAHPSYPIGINETQAEMGSLPVAGEHGLSTSTWTMPPAW